MLAIKILYIWDSGREKIGLEIIEDYGWYFFIEFFLD